MGFPTLSVEVAFGDPTGGTFADYVSEVNRIETHRGRQRPLNAYMAGLSVIEFNNLAGKYDQNNLSGPHISAGRTVTNAVRTSGSQTITSATAAFVARDLGRGVSGTGIVAGSKIQTILSPTQITIDIPATSTGSGGTLTLATTTLVQPMSALRIKALWSAVSYPMYYGYADSFQPVYSNPSVTKAQFTDAFKVFAANTFRTTLTPGQGAGEDTGARINRCLTYGNWTGGRRLDVGNSLLQATTFPAQRTLLAEMQLAVDSEFGYLYMGADGYVTFKNRNSRAQDTVSNTSQYTFGDAGGELPCIHPDPTRDDLLTINEVISQKAGGVSNMNQDPNSIGLYLLKSHSRTDLIVQLDADANQWGANILHLYNQPQDYISPIILTPYATSDSLWPAVLGLDIGHRVTVNVTPPYGGTRVSIPCFVEGIHHVIEPGKSWRVTLDLLSAAFWNTTSPQGPGPQFVFILDSATQGVLDQNQLS